MINRQKRTRTTWALCVTVIAVALWVWVTSPRALDFRGTFPLHAAGAMGSVWFAYIPGDGSFEAMASAGWWWRMGDDWWWRLSLEDIDPGWVLRVPVWVVLVPPLGYMARVWLRRRPLLACARCGYDLARLPVGSGGALACPECGHSPAKS
jgi:hypothetical protein